MNLGWWWWGYVEYTLLHISNKVLRMDINNIEDAHSKEEVTLDHLAICCLISFDMLETSGYYCYNVAYLANNHG